MVFMLLFFPVFIFLLWKCRYGFGNIDEAFYLTIPYRLLQGDALFVHEWHLSQMAGVLTMPFVSVLMQIRGNTDGLILSMRYITIFVQCFIAFCAYYRLRDFNWLGAVCSAICFALYIPFSIMALSYNSMGIMFLTLSCLLLLPCKKADFSFFVSGLAYAAACLCCPPLVIVYFLAIAVITIQIHMHHRWKAVFAFTDHTFQKTLYFSLGAFLMAVMFAGFVFSRASLQQIVQAFSFIMNDPEHPAVPLIEKVVSYGRSIIFATDQSAIIYAVLAFLFVICSFDAKRKRRKREYFIAVSACTIVLMLSHYFQHHYLNKVMWAINIPCVFIVLLSDKPENRCFFSVFWILGMLYSFCIHLTSNQEFYAISSASSVAVIGSIMMLAEFLEEIPYKRRDSKRSLLAAGCVMMILGVQLFTEATLRYSNVFWETGVDSQTVLVEDGIQAGLYVSEKRADYYAAELENLERIKQYRGDKILYLSGNTWFYLTDTHESASYSAWLSGVNEESLGRLEAYYQLNPDKLPDIVYTDISHKDIAITFAQRRHYQIHDDGQYIILTK